MTAIDWILVAASLPISAGALALTLVNLRRYHTLENLGLVRARAGGATLMGDTPGANARGTTGARAEGTPGGVLLSVCIPARNEEANLARCVASVLEGTSAADSDVEVLVYDDQSTDRTPEILGELCAKDARVRSVKTSPLPSGWNGKQHACDALGRAARGAWLLFIDADVTFVPGGALRERLRPAFEHAEREGIALLSTFPCQRTESLGERLIVPMIHFILFSYLPMGRMRSTLDPAASAACGQFILVRKDAYVAAGGHAAFKASMHDGVMMPRALRRAGYKTDLFDGTALCSVRMYSGLGATWRGFAKNAYEGLGNPVLLVLLTALHVVGHILPWGVLAWWAGGAPLGSGAVKPGLVACAAALGCVACNVVQRGLLARRFFQPWVGIMLHPIGVGLMTAIQWHSGVLYLFGKRSWRGRTA